MPLRAAVLAIGLAGTLGLCPSAFAGQSPQAILSLPTGADFPSSDQFMLLVWQNGLRTKAALQAFVQEPDDPATIALLLSVDRRDEALGVLRAIVARHPDRVARAFEIVNLHASKFFDIGDGRGAILSGLVAEARALIPQLSPEDAARTELYLHNLSRFPIDRRLTFTFDRVFVSSYPGTETARATEVDALPSSTLQDLDALERFARARPGTIEAAKALYRVGFALGRNSTLLFPRQQIDPEPLFVRVVNIAKELESGAYPRSTWVAQATDLVTGFGVYQPSYGAGSPVRMIALYTEFIRTHSPPSAADYSVAFAAISKLPELFRASGEGWAGFERWFDAFEGDAVNPDPIRFRRAEFYLAPGWPGSEDRVQRRARATEIFESLRRSGNAEVHSRALAHLASMSFTDYAFERARGLFREYAALYPTSDYAWVAALHAAQCEQEMGRLPTAIAEYQGTAQRYAHIPMAVVLGETAAARLLETLGQFDEARDAYRRAIAAWDPDYGDFMRLEGRPETRAVRSEVELTLERLNVSMRAAGGALVERGRWLLDHDRLGDAGIPLREFLEDYPDSPVLATGRYLYRKVQLLSELQSSDLDNPEAVPPHAMEYLDQIASGPYDFGVFAARVMSASLTWLSKDTGRGEAMMREALVEWERHQRGERERPRSPLEEDVAAIRAEAMRVEDGRVLSGLMRVPDGPTAPATAWTILNPAIRVKAAGSHRWPVEMDVYQSIAGNDRVLFLTGEQQALLRRILRRLEGRSQFRAGRPVTDIADFWADHFGFTQRAGVPRRFPNVAEIDFGNEERTRAAVVVGLQGGMHVAFEKIEGRWVAKEITTSISY